MYVTTHWQSWRHNTNATPQIVMRSVLTGGRRRLEAELQPRWNTAENSEFLGKGQGSRQRSDTEDEREAGDITRGLPVADSLTLIMVWNSILSRQLCLTSLHLDVDISTCDIFQQSP